MLAVKMAKLMVKTRKPIVLGSQSLNKILITSKPVLDHTFPSLITDSAKIVHRRLLD